MGGEQKDEEGERWKFRLVKTRRLLGLKVQVISMLTEAQVSGKVGTRRELIESTTLINAARQFAQRADAVWIAIGHIL